MASQGCCVFLPHNSRSSCINLPAAARDGRARSCVPADSAPGLDCPRSTGRGLQLLVMDTNFRKCKKTSLTSLETKEGKTIFYLRVIPAVLPHCRQVTPADNTDAATPATPWGRETLQSRVTATAKLQKRDQSILTEV